MIVVVNIDLLHGKTVVQGMKLLSESEVGPRFNPNNSSFDIHDTT